MIVDSTQFGEYLTLQQKKPYLQLTVVIDWPETALDRNHPGKY